MIRQSSDHGVFLLTRFAIKPDSELLGFTQGGDRSRLYLDPGWLERRLELLEDYCLPSVLGQTDKNFEWFVAVDAQVSKDFVERLESVLAGHASIITLQDGEPFSLSAALGADQVPSQHVTIRLDSDDCISRDFVARVRRHSECGAVLNFPIGAEFIPAKCAIVRRKIMSNPFIAYHSSSIEDVFSFEAHSRLPQNVRTKNIWTSRPMYLRVNHQLNTAQYKQNGFPFLRPRRIATQFSLELSSAKLEASSALWIAISFVGSFIYRVSPQLGILLVRIQKKMAAVRD